MVEILFGANAGESPEAALVRMSALPRLRPFDERACAFVKRFATVLLADAGVRAHPDILAFAFAMRGARIRELQTAFESGLGARVVPRSRGLAVHFAPSNVDTVFAYSWFLSMLSGNANVVRLSRRRNAAADVLVAHIATVLREPEFAPLAERSLVLTYDHDESVTARLSAACDLRVIWGGDAAVDAIRRAPLRPSAEEVVFADRFSLAALSADAILAMDESVLGSFVRDFRNDTLTFGQMGCSSPRCLVWVGESTACAAASARLGAALDSLLRGADAGAWSQPISARLASAYVMATSGVVSAVRVAMQPPLMWVDVSALPESLRDRHPGGGCFLQVSRARLIDMVDLVSPKDQTLVAHGFAPSELRELLEAPGCSGIDRVVPVGGALDFSHLWDGQDLLRRFTRITSIQTQ